MNITKDLLEYIGYKTLSDKGELNYDKLYTRLKKGRSKIFLIYFYYDCYSDKTYEKYINMFSKNEKLLSFVNVIECNVASNPHFAGLCNIKEHPTFMIVQNKKMLDKKEGQLSEQEFTTWIQSIPR